MAIILIVLAIILMLKNSKSATTPDPNETQKKQAKLFYSGFIMFAVGGIAISILSSAPMVSTEISRIYIPVQNVQNFTLNYSNNTYVFFDDSGNCFVVPEEQAIINTSPDVELETLTVCKVVISKKNSDFVTFLTDFGVISNNIGYRKPYVEEIYEFSIPETCIKLSSQK